MYKPWIQQSNWHIRRRFMFTVSAFCMLAISYVLVAEVKTEAAEAAVTMGFATLLGIVGSYVFGATWEDISLGQQRLGHQPTRNPLNEDEPLRTIPEEP